jgi:glycosyltransferase involved in cell wall biosynthesis
MTIPDAQSIEQLKTSGCFDQEWYVSQYPDVLRLRLDAAEHFLRIGVNLGRNPSPSVSNAEYRERFGDHATPSKGGPSFAAAPSPGAPAVNQRVAVPSPLTGRTEASYFDASRYLEEYPDLVDPRIDAYRHFVDHGFEEGRIGWFFDNDWYLAQHKDVRNSGANGYQHYRDSGKSEKRQCRFVEVKLVVENGRSFYASQDYKVWVDQFDADDRDRELYDLCIEGFSYRPTISITMPVYKVELKYLREAIDSLLTQSYANIEICVADDCSNDPEIVRLLEAYAASDRRFKYVVRKHNGNISAATNSALELATGEFVGLMDHDDLLHKHAVFWVVEALNRDNSLDMIYTDEDKIDEFGNRTDPHFKSDFNYELFLAQNMVSHFAVYRTSTLKEIGGFREGFEGSQDYDMTLRFLDAGGRKVAHVPRVLYHWRAIEGSTAFLPSEKAYTDSASIRALRDHVARNGWEADVTVSPELSYYFRVRFHVVGNPLVSIIIPTKDKVDLLDQCIGSITAKSTYTNYEIIVVDNGSVEAESFAYFERIAGQGVKVIHDSLPFNYSRINNLGFSQIAGEHVCLMNNDIEIITPDWLEEMLSFSQWADVGCVGARLWYPDDTLQHGGVITGLGGVAGHSHKYFERGSVGYFGRAVLPQALSAVTAACLMVKSSVFARVNGLDEGLSVAFNDVDFCLRIREAGYRNVWTPYAEMYHHESASRGSEDTPEKIARFKREIDFMKDRWGQNLATDPYYSPNLTIEREDFSFAKLPRTPGIRDIAAGAGR